MKKKIMNKLTKTYKKYYKLLLIIPLLLILFSGFMITQTINKKGVPIYRDISLKGGESVFVTINTGMTLEKLTNTLEINYKDNTFSISELSNNGKQTGFVIDTDLEDKILKNKLNELFETSFIDGQNYNANIISSSLSLVFFSQAIKILIFSFILMSIAIFIYFKEFVPSCAVVLSGLFDLIVTIGILDFFKIKMSIAGIGALLMLIGYSIDTDILLTNRLIKEKGTNYFEKVFDAFKTGLVMSITTLLAGSIALYFTNSSVIYQISLIIVIGLLVDMISTWVQNSSLLLWWLENKNIK